MRAAVRWNVKHGADVIKTCATGGVLSLNDDVDSPQLTQEELNALVDQAHSMRKKTAAHAHGAEGAKRAVRAGIDSIEHGSFLDDEALQLMIQKGTYYVPTLMALESIKEKLGRGAKMDPRTERKARIAIDSTDAVVKKSDCAGRTDCVRDRQRRLRTWTQCRGVPASRSSGYEADRHAEGCH
jgi:imidazolonepropionase-like amidohydrolase